MQVCQKNIILMKKIRKTFCYKKNVLSKCKICDKSEERETNFYEKATVHKKEKRIIHYYCNFLSHEMCRLDIAINLCSLVDNFC